MEFRAVLEDDCNLSEGGNLMLLICGRGHYPMRRHPRLENTHCNARQSGSVINLLNGVRQRFLFHF